MADLRTLKYYPRARPFSNCTLCSGVNFTIFYSSGMA